RLATGGQLGQHPKSGYCPETPEPELPSPTARLESIQPYVFTTLIARKRLLEADGHAMLDLSLGSPDQPMPDALIQAVADGVSDKRAHGYPVMIGEHAFHAAFAAFMLRRFGVEFVVPAECGQPAGAKEALAHLVLAYCEPGDAML